jgi:hypothetical protein
VPNAFAGRIAVGGWMVVSFLHRSSSNAIDRIPVA